MIGFVGLGKLGLPVATAIASRGFHVLGTDPYVGQYPADLSHEQHFAQTVDVVENTGDCSLSFTDLDRVVKECSLIFVAVQTPHEKEYGGAVPLPQDRKDFDYSHLRIAVGDIGRMAERHKVSPTVCVISTVLPGTMRSVVEPELGRASLAYNPAFIAMGTAIADWMDPEFILIGGDPKDAVQQFYRKALPGATIVKMPIRDAELTKVAYNTFIGMKLAFVNTLAEICARNGGNVDNVTDALSMAGKRIISSAYMKAGMGDGGGCHPRDNIALSWLSRKLDLSHDLFEDIMMQREAHAEWLADKMLAHGAAEKLPLAIYGVAYKPQSHLMDGSPALLVKSLLHAKGHFPVLYDPYALPAEPLESAAVILIGCNHTCFQGEERFPTGSVIIDPFGDIPPKAGCVVISPGRFRP